MNQTKISNRPNRNLPTRFAAGLAFLTSLAIAAPAFALESGIYTLQQASSLRFMDAHTSDANDFRAVTRVQQSNATQRWIITELRNGDYRIQQESTRRFLDAHESSGPDFSIVTRDFQANDTQEWIIE